MTAPSQVADVFATSWGLSVAVEIDAPAARVYDMASDVTRMGEWSPECFGGRWVSGTPGTVGARFHGFNREDDAVWTSESEVLDAQRPRTFRFSVLAFCPGEPGPATDWIGGSQPGDMTWSFEIEERGSGCVLTQRHAMNVVSPFYRGMLESMTEDERPASMAARKEHLRHAMEQTLDRIRAAAEKQA